MHTSEAKNLDFKDTEMWYERCTLAFSTKALGISRNNSLNLHSIFSINCNLTSHIETEFN